VKKQIQVVVECDVKDLKEFEERLRRVEKLPRMLTGLPPLKVLSVCFIDPLT
jgi:hypothetical protein